MASGDAPSNAEAVLEVWIRCQPESYLVKEGQLMELLTHVAAALPVASHDELFKPRDEGRQHLFMQMMRPQKGTVHFLNFWQAFTQARQLAGNGQGGITEGISSELEALRDALLRRLEVPCDDAAVASQGAALGAESDERVVPAGALVEELRRAAAMSAQPRFWKRASEALEREHAREALCRDKLADVLLNWLLDAASWDFSGSREPDRNPTPGQVGLAQAPVSGTVVRLHVYDVSQQSGIQRLNSVLAPALTGPLKLGGVFHAGVEVNGIEWSYGYQPQESRCGVCSCLPTRHDQHNFRETIVLRETRLSADKIADVISQLIEEYPGNDYDLLRRNCCHFADDFCIRLGVGSIPGWVHRLARIGARFEQFFRSVRSVADDVIPREAVSNRGALRE